MKISAVEGVVCAARSEQFPVDERWQVAFVGRSNVGKSSLINSFVNRKKLAKTSNTPGKTRAVYFYLVNGSFYLVDLPGYGYAKVSMKLRQEWALLLRSYFDNHSRILLLVHLLDIRHPPSAGDKQMVDWIKHYRLPCLIVATKADKIPRGRRAHCLKILREGLGISQSYLIIPFSAKTGEGRDALQSFIEASLGGVGVHV